MELWRRHDLLGIATCDAFDEGAGFGFARDDRGDAFVVALCGFLEIEAETGFAALFVRAVAGEAIFGKDGADIAAEGGIGGAQRWDEGSEEGGECCGERGQGAVHERRRAAERALRVGWHVWDGVWEL